MSGENEQTPEVNPMQQRIDDLTARLAQATEQIAQVQSKFAEQMARMPVADPTKTTPSDPYAGMIPDTLSDEQKTFMRTLLDNTAKIIDSRVSPVMSGMAAIQGREKMASFSEAKYAHLNSEVKKQAAEFYADWQARGGPAAAFTPDDAIKFAIGNTALSADPRANQPTIPGFNNPAPRQVVPDDAPLPPNFDDLDPDKQYEILAKRIGDKPF